MKIFQKKMMLSRKLTNKLTERTIACKKTKRNLSWTLRK